MAVEDDPEVLLSRIVYGELLASPADTNHRGRVYRAYDGAGVATSLAFDFKGHALEEQRQLVNDKTTQPDWSDLLGEDTLADMATAAASLLVAETFSASSERDALGRVLTAISPDGSEVHYGYDEGGALQQVTLHHRGSVTEQTVVGDITYDAKGRHEEVVYGPTGSPTSTTTYTYDALSQRLTRLRTVRASDSEAIQSLHYHYDPVGNITDIRDTAQQTVYFDNTVVAAANSYSYDALYRLVEATGREHSSERTGQRTHADMTATAQPMASDPSAMRLYTQQFVYDAVGNILEMKHLPSSGTGWTRYYQYDELGNRLEATSASGDDPEGPYTHEYPYDEHGNMVAMPHLSAMIWNHDDELQEVTAGSETVYFQYAGGNRSRKYVEKSLSTTEERIYLGNFEIYRKRVSSTLTVERESLHISDGTGRILLIETKTIDGGTAVTTPIGIWRYQLSNHIGSASTEITEAGDIISYEEYHPYGTTAYHAVDSSLGVSAKRYRYTGMERDEETGLSYHTARYYASWLGRWTASDPIGLRGGGNRYKYVGVVVAADRNGQAPPSSDEDPTQFRPDPDPRIGQPSPLEWMRWAVASALMPIVDSWADAPDAAAAVAVSTADHVKKSLTDFTLKPKYEQTIAQAKKLGLPTAFLTDSKDSGHTNFLPGYGGDQYLTIGNTLAVRESTYDKFLLNEDPVALGTIYHEATHAWVDWQLDDGDIKVTEMVARAAEYYKGAQLKGGEQSSDPDRIAHEAIATYVGNRVSQYAIQKNRLASIIELVDDGTLTAEDALRHVYEGHTYGEYQSAMARTVYGYEENSEEGSGYTTTKMPDWLRDWVDQEILEGFDFEYEKAFAEELGYLRGLTANQGSP